MEAVRASAVEVICLRRLFFGFALLFAGIRDTPRGAGVALCGAAPTFFVPQGDFLRGASAKKVGKESGLTPPMLVLTHGLLTSPYFVANPPIKCLTRFQLPRFGPQRRAFPLPVRKTLCRRSRRTGNPRTAMRTLECRRRRVWRDNLHRVCRKWALKHQAR